MKKIEWNDIRRNEPLVNNEDQSVFRLMIEVNERLSKLDARLEKLEGHVSQSLSVNDVQDVMAGNIPIKSPKQEEKTLAEKFLNRSDIMSHELVDDLSNISKAHYLETFDKAMPKVATIPTIHELQRIRKALEEA